MSKNFESRKWKKKLISKSPSSHLPLSKSQLSSTDKNIAIYLIKSKPYRQTMDFESDPAAEFLSREREELGDLENEIISSNGEWNLGRIWEFFYHRCFYSLIMTVSTSYRSTSERCRLGAALQRGVRDDQQWGSIGWTRWWWVVGRSSWMIHAFYNTHEKISSQHW